MKIVTVVGACLMLSLPLTVSARSENSSFSLRIISGQFDGGTTYSVGADTMLDGVAIQMSIPTAVQLDADVPTNLAKKVGSSKKSPLSKGTILYAAGGSQTTYCGRGWGNWNVRYFAPCLTDTDNDGRFDQGVLNRDGAKHPVHVIMDNEDGTFIHGSVPNGPPVAFATPVAYHRIDPITVPESQVIAGIKVLSNYDANKRGAIRFGFSVWQSGKWAFGDLFSDIREVTYNGSPVDVDIFGIKLTVVGIDEKGNPLCKLEGHIDDQVVPFLAQNVVERIIFY